MTYWNFFGWQKHTQESVVGQIFYHPLRGDEYLGITLDAQCAGWFHTQHTYISVFKVRVHKTGDDELRVHVPSTDDLAMYADFRCDTGLTLCQLRELVYAWAEERNYRNINVLELADYCTHLGAYNIDWS